MTSDPNTPAWWSDQADIFTQKVTASVTATFLDGVVNSGYKPRNPQQITQMAQGYLNPYLNSSPTATKSDQYRIASSVYSSALMSDRLVDAWKKGKRVKPLAEVLEPVFGKSRAEMIAITETTRLQSAGQIEAWKASGEIAAKMWVTSEDERVCPLCGPLHGSITVLSGGWAITESLIAMVPELQKALSGPTTVQHPPIHPRCRCRLRPVPVSELPNVIDAYWKPNDLANQLFAKVQAAKQADTRAALDSITAKVAKETEKVVLSQPAQNRKIWDWFKGDDSFGRRTYSGVATFTQKAAGAAKDKISTVLAERTNIPYDWANDIIKTWARTSNDNDLRSLMMQKWAGEVFGIELSDWQDDKLFSVEEKRRYADKTNIGGAFTPFEEAGRYLMPFEQGYDDLDPKIAGYYGTSEKAGKHFIKEMYDWTQEELKKTGVTSVKLYRGVLMDIDERPPHGEQATIEDANVIESYSIEAGVAADFGNVVYETVVPIEDIVATSRTGFGCLDEWEFVVKNDPDRVYNVYHSKVPEGEQWQSQE